MLRNLKLHLTGLARFSGREARGLFWPWLAVLMVLNMAAAMIVMVPIMLSSISKMSRFVREHPDQGTITVGPGSYSVEVHGHHPELMPDISGFMTTVEVCALVTVALLAAAVARRLHDCDRRAFWGLLPLPFLATGLILLPPMFSAVGEGGEPDMSLFFGLFINNLVYLAMLGLLVFCCAQPGTPGENRFGPPPA